MRQGAVHVTGTQEVQRALAAFGREVAADVSKAVVATALEALTDVRKAIQGPPKTGREYPRGANGDKIHRASAPGEAPATDTGALVSSTYLSRIDDTTQAIGSRLDYAFFLEFGTLRMEPRPSWVPAAERAAPRLEKRLRRVIAEARARAERTTR
jgi:phage gpG-like protein